MKIREVSKLLGVEAYVLRYWETEFPELRPRRTEGGQREYSESDLQLLRKLVDLLHVRRFTIEGAKRLLEDDRPEEAGSPAQEGFTERERSAAASAESDAQALLRRIRLQLQELHDMLSRRPKS